jgi:hypothetical protein
MLQLIGAYRLYWWWRDRCVSTLINFRLRWSVRKSSLLCSQGKPLLVLVDNTVHKHATTHLSGRVSTEIFPHGDGDIETFYFTRFPALDEEEIAGLDPNTSPENSKIIAMHDDVKFLSGIAYLARKGALKLCTSAVLMAERNYQQNRELLGIGYDDLNLLSDIELEPIDGYLLSEIGGDTSTFPYSKATVKSFLDNVNDQRYCDIKNALSAGDSQDAWHIRTAEKFGAICFLTMDYKLLEKLRKQMNVDPINSLKTYIWTPADLGKYLDLDRVSPNCMSYYRADGPVRNNVEILGQKRRKIQDFQ